MAKKPRRVINRYVRLLSKLYQMEYNEVLKIYNQMDRNLNDTTVVLKLINL